jgi:RimJ/RimL family protein N-acetyltransferase
VTPAGGGEDVPEPTVDPEFIRRRTVEITLRDGTRVRLRPVIPEDKQRLVEGLERLSQESRYRRFMTAVARIPPRQLAYFTEIDYVDHHAIGALALDEPGEPGIGVARCVRLAEAPHCAEVAVVIVDDYHGRGLGTLLLRAVAAVALEHGIREFQAEILGDNRAARALVTRLGARIERSGNPILFSMDITRWMDDIRGTALHDVLQALARGEADRLTSQRR